jgi:hypothetical protein
MRLACGVTILSGVTIGRMAGRMYLVTDAYQSDPTPTASAVRPQPAVSPPMTPALRKLESMVGFWVVVGPMLLLIGGVFLFSPPGLVAALAIVAMVAGSVLLLAGLVGKVAIHALHAIDETHP